MFAPSRRLLARLGRWPRRIAALVCLLLAAGSALAPQRPAGPAPVSSGVGASLHPGEVAVPVSVTESAGAHYVRPGDRVGVLAGPADAGTDPAADGALLVADQLRVLSVQAPDPGLESDAAAVVLVATDRTHAVELARYATRPLLVVIDQIPRIPAGGGATGHRP